MKALDAAKILINLSLDNQKPITNLKLQKMLYIAQAESDSKLIKIKEDFQAWDYGPVIPDVYCNFCINGSTPITKREEIPNNIDREKEKELAKIYNQYKDADAWNMVRATHQKESAWSKHHVKGMRKVIKRDDIKADKELLQEALLPNNKP
ncbi:DUF4065 domain-containing protein [Helicobacter pylori]|uniref:Panacea domain-containing protein n=1 Tax=Helicobacter pylori TaxID=210 RepID=UPI001237A764|nr:type II toxin-antitoxin system antitoxin SocA domain-containing protein [Helicobacter pylori]KAA6507698.1 DUF4065 domain-containing protein [Helicobacter pylori]KAA6510420.1 DUF4065 domain-containing protein [Helicobacter pylori]KAA6515270.1 DUF4065 domain-containing protein [Helicobacter pylori]